MISFVGMDYINLRNLLAAGKWQEADAETARLMLKVAGREKEGYLDVEHINNFPCEELRKIDQLWVKYSNGRFGFSVQKHIYQTLGGTTEYDSKSWEAFGDRVDWCVNGHWSDYDDLEFNTKATKGLLSTWWWPVCLCVGLVGCLFLSGWFGQLWFWFFYCLSFLPR